MVHYYNYVKGVQDCSRGKAPAMMDLKLRMIENPDDEYAGCIILEEKKTIAFKVDFMSDLVKAMQTMETE